MPSRDDALNLWVDEILGQHRNLNFVQRVMEPASWPTIKMGKGRASHLMSWATVGSEKRPIVYPTIIYDPATKTLRRLAGKEAVEHAIRTGEFISFDTEKEADLFSREYKRYWRKRW